MGLLVKQVCIPSVLFLSFVTLLPRDLSPRKGKLEAEKGRRGTRPHERQFRRIRGCVQTNKTLERTTNGGLDFRDLSCSRRIATTRTNQDISDACISESPRCKKKMMMNMPTISKLLLSSTITFQHPPFKPACGDHSKMLCHSCG